MADAGALAGGGFEKEAAVTVGQGGEDAPDFTGDVLDAPVGTGPKVGAGVEDHVRNSQLSATFEFGREGVHDVSRILRRADHAVP